MTILEELESYLEKWRKSGTNIMPDGIQVEIQVGDFRQVRKEHKLSADHIAFTMSPDNKQFILAFDEDALLEEEPAKREHIFLHELVHANICFNVGDDIYDQMEQAVDECANLLASRCWKPHHKGLGGSVDA